MKKNAFTMIELVFVIVVIGILASIAVPKFAATRTDAQIAKARADISSIRSAIISERQTRLIKGDATWINSLSNSTTTLFDGNGSAELLMYGIKASTTSGHWATSDASTPYVNYNYYIDGSTCQFTYSSANGTFTLNNAQPAICDSLVN